MPVERLEDGTYRVGSMIFATADQAFDHDAHVGQAAAPAATPAPQAAPVSKPRGRQGSQWSRMSVSSRVGAVAAGSLLLIIVIVAGSQWLRPSTSAPRAVATVRPPVSTPPAARPAPADAPVPAAVAPAIISPSSAWQYDEKVDQMTGKKSVSALLTSDNQLHLSSPYSGPQNGALIVRRHPQYGLDVIVSIYKGQILCHSYDCKVSVKFDDAAPISFGGTEPADNSTTSVFLNSAERFITLAKKSKRILVQLNMYQNGSQVLEFSTPVALEWPPK